MWCILYVAKVMERYFILLHILSSLSLPAISTEEVQPTTLQSIYNEPSSDDIPEITTHKKTLIEQVNEQAEAIRKIISAHKSPESDYPIVTKQEADVKHKIPPAPMREVIEQETIETLKVKCEHLAKLQKNELGMFKLTPQSDDNERLVTPVSQYLVTERTDLPRINQNQSPYQYVKPLISDYRQRLQPQNNKQQGFYIINNNQANQSLNQKDKLTPAASNINQYFYSTVPPTTTTVQPVSSLSPQAGSINQNYVKMEPVVLQRTMLTNGNMLFYWYRPLRNMQNTELVSYNYQNQQEQIAGGQGNQYYPFYPMRRKEELPSTKTTTTTTTEKSPQIEIDYGSQEPDNNLYRSQYRFVLPMAYKVPDTVESEPPQFDQYAYLPEHLRPTLMNLQLPYMPTYHVIKAVAVPKREEVNSYREEGMYGHGLMGVENNGGVNE